HRCRPPRHRALRRAGRGRAGGRSAGPDPAVHRHPEPGLNTMVSPILLTLGDACGIGPEIIAGAWLGEEQGDLCVVGDVAVMRRAIGSLGLTLPVARVASPAELAEVPP